MNVSTSKPNSDDPIVITKGSCYGDLNLVGKDPIKRQADNPLRIRTAQNELTVLDHVKIRDCGMPLRHESGKLKIETLDCKRFTADLLNSHGELEITNLVVDFDGSNFTAEDYELIHPDALGQFFDHVTKTVANVSIHNIYARIKGELIQGFMLSEKHRYTNFQIGTGVVDIQLEYKYAFSAITLENSFINVGDNGVRIKNVKNSKYQSNCVELMRYSKDQLIITDFDSESSNMIQGNYLVIPNRLDMTKEQHKYWNNRWPNFKTYELDSRDWSIKLYLPALDALQALRTDYGKSLKINSAWRTPSHNKLIGGKKNSDHTEIEDREINASGYDVHINSIAEGRKIEKLAIEKGFNVIGRYRKSMFIHISKRKPKPKGLIYQWGYW